MLVMVCLHYGDDRIAGKAKWVDRPNRPNANNIATNMLLVIKMTEFMSVDLRWKSNLRMKYIFKK